jgi:hypothetical protein
MRDEVTRTATDATAALDFIKSQFKHTDGPVNVCVLKNDSKGAGATITSRDPAVIDAFIRKQDKPGHGVYFCVSTLSGEDKIHAKEAAVELAFAHVDTDMKDIINETPESALAKIRALKYPPSRIVWSGHGWHSYWLYTEPLVLPTDDTRQAAIEEYDNFLGVLCDYVGGDSKPAHVAGLMRVVGSHNTKNGDWIRVQIVEDNGHRYDLGDLKEWQTESSPKILRKDRERDQSAGQRGNVWEEFAKNFKTPVDVEKRLAAMQFMGTGPASIHDTQLSVTASMLNAGVPIDEVVSVVKAATVVAAGDYGKRWNWTREENAIRGMCKTWLKKHPPTPSAKSTSSSQSAGATVHSLAEARDKKAEPKPKSQKVIDRENMHAMIGGAVLDVLTKGNTPIMIVVDQLWRYQNDLWIEVDGKGRFHLDRVIETCIRALPDNVTSTIKLVAEVRAWLMRNPDIGRDDIKWDDHGKIAVKGGLIDPITLVFQKAKPEHHVTARINCDYDANAQCPVWLEMLEATFADRDDKERTGTIDLIQEVVGCATIEDKSKALSRALIFHGISNTGKTDLIKTISGLLTDNPIATPLEGLEGTHGLMEFTRNAPWVLHEAFDKQKWHFSATVKSILSGDPVQINIKNGALITRRIRQSIFWGTNIPPQFKEATRAIINRMVVVNCFTVFEPDAPIGVALKARAAGYAEPSDLILASEKPGLLNWALVGLRRALDRGYFEMTDDMKATLETIRTDSNLVASFLDECCSFAPGNMISTSDFCAALAAHWEENKEGQAPSNDSIGKAMAGHGDPRIGVDREALRDNKRHYYAGIHLNGIGLDYWAGAAGEGLARGKTARLSSNINDVNRAIPAGFQDKSAVLKMKRHFEKLLAADAAGAAAAADKAPRF